jgi:hypothetical protein
MDQSLQHYADEIRHTANVAWFNYEIWWVYKSADTRPEYLGTMNAYPLFFQTSLHAHFVALLVALYRLFETRHDTYNIPGFLKLLGQQGAVPSEVGARLQKMYDEAKPLWVKVCILRNKAFGHRSRAHTVGEVFAEAGVTPDDLRSLVEVTRRLLNAATQAASQTTHAFNLSARDDTLRVLDDLKARREC